MMNGFGIMGSWGWLGMVSMTLLWIAVVVLIVWGLSRAFATPTSRVEQDALGILKQRFARGEISQAEYEQAQHAISG